MILFKSKKKGNEYKVNNFSNLQAMSLKQRIWTYPAVKTLLERENEMEVKVRELRP